MSNFTNTSISTTVPDEWATAEVTAVCVILGLAFLVGAPGNIFVVWTILQHVKQRSHTVVLILHLAAADLLVLITLPLWIYSLGHSWVFGPTACKIVVYMVICSMYSSVFLIMAMSVERYVAIRFPFSLMSRERRNMVRKSLVGIWLLAFLLGIPAPLTQRMDEMEGEPQCLMREYSSVGEELACLSVECFMGFMIPFTVLGICYYKVAKHLQQMNPRPKHKSYFLITCVVIAFVVCWTPYHLVNLVVFMGSLVREEISETTETFRHTMSLISGALVFISSSVNPILYTFAARRFQGSLRKSYLIKLFQETASHTTHNTGQDRTKSTVTQISSHADLTAV